MDDELVDTIKHFMRFDAEDDYVRRLWHRNDICPVCQEKPRLPVTSSSCCKACKGHSYVVDGLSRWIKPGCKNCKYCPKHQGIKKDVMISSNPIGYPCCTNHECFEKFRDSVQNRIYVQNYKDLKCVVKSCVLGDRCVNKNTSPRSKSNADKSKGLCITQIDLVSNGSQVYLKMFSTMFCCEKCAEMYEGSPFMYGGKEYKSVSEFILEYGESYAFDGFVEQFRQRDKSSKFYPLINVRGKCIYECLE